MIKVLIISVFVLLGATLQAQTERKSKDAKGLDTGSFAPLFEAQTSDNKTFNLANTLKKSSVVLIFYRGHWCPVCNKHLQQVQDSIKLITDLGAKVIAVSPEKPEFANEMKDKTGASFSILYDEDYNIAKAYNVSFNPSTVQTFVYNTFLGANLKEAHSDKSQRLPIPATYIIGKNGIITWRHFNPDHTERSSIKAIVNHLSELVKIQ